jgi:hypothetical protein
MDIRWVEEFFRSEWAVIAGAPLLSFLLLAFGVVAGWLMARAFHSERIKTLESQISDYRERRGFGPQESNYAKLTNAELRMETERFVGKLRAFHRDMMADRADSTARLIRQTIPTDKEAIQRAREAETQAMVRKSEQEQTRFIQEFRPEALNLREEMERRLPVDAIQSSRSGPRPIALDVGMLAGVDPVGDVIVLLDRLAKLLPKRR